MIGTIRRECLDRVIPWIEAHLRQVLREWVPHYNCGRPHASLGPGIPDGRNLAPVSKGHRIGDGHRVIAKPILRGLHHEYRLEPRAA
ncbi:MAG: integrase [Acidobacteria bacterium]|nr:MAG: integrase [Acidobacteriota bacterium]